MERNSDNSSSGIRSHSSRSMAGGTRSLRHSNRNHRSSCGNHSGRSGGADNCRNGDCNCDDNRLDTRYGSMNYLPRRQRTLKAAHKLRMQREPRKPFA